MQSDILLLGEVMVRKAQCYRVNERKALRSGGESSLSLLSFWRVASRPFLSLPLVISCAARVEDRLLAVKTVWTARGVV